MRAKPLVVLGAGAALLAPAPAAFADKQIEAAAPNRYTTPNVTMDQGERLTFLNRDGVLHDVTAVQTGEDRKPLFATPLVDRGQSAFVEGSQYLTTGSYAFLCSVHPEMKGTLNVSSAGTPAQRPGTGGGGGADTTAPVAEVAAKTGSVRKARKDRALKVAVTLDEAAKTTVRASLGGKSLSSRRLDLKAGTTVVVLRLDAADLRRIKKGRSIALSVAAVDAAGNKGTAKAGRKLR